MSSGDDTTFGRERELARFDEVVAEVAHGGRHTLVVCGSAGIGTTTLIDALVRRASSSRTPAAGGTLPGHRCRCPARSRAASPGRPAERAARSPRAAQRPRPIRSPTAATDPQPSGIQNGSPFDQLRFELTRAARRRPVLLVIEDLH